MKPVSVLFVLLMLALLALPLASFGESISSGAAEQVPIRGGSGHGYRYGGGQGATSDDAMRHGPGAMPQAARHGQERSASSRAQAELQRDPFDWNATVRPARFRS